MGKLERAIQLANERKLAVLGEDAPMGINHTDDEMADRRVFLGWELDYDELTDASANVGTFFSYQAHTNALIPLFISAWIDGLLTGLFAASLPPTGPDSEPDRTGPEGGK